MSSFLLYLFLTYQFIKVKILIINLIFLLYYLKSFFETTAGRTRFRPTGSDVPSNAEFRVFTWRFDIQGMRDRRSSMGCRWDRTSRGSERLSGDGCTDHPLPPRSLWW